MASLPPTLKVHPNHVIRNTQKRNITNSHAPRLLALKQLKSMDQSDGPMQLRPNLRIPYDPLGDALPLYQPTMNGPLNTWIPHQSLTEPVINKSSWILIPPTTSIRDPWLLLCYNSNHECRPIHCVPTHHLSPIQTMA